MSPYDNANYIFFLFLFSRERGLPSRVFALAFCANTVLYLGISSHTREENIWKSLDLLTLTSLNVRWIQGDLVPIIRQRNIYDEG